MNLMSREAFIAEVRDAVTTRRPYAAGKLGTSEKTWMYYEVLLAANPTPRQRLAFEASLKFHARFQSGVFPARPEFLRDFNRRYVEAVRQLDTVGLFRDHPVFEEGIVRHYGLTNRWTYYEHQEPDRSVPARDDLCYLPSLRDKKLLLVCPFAELLRERATKAVFEGVWAKTGKRWFEPDSVQALEFPYGYDPETEVRFGTALSLHEHIADAMAARRFDVALIAAGGLGVPLAATAKSLGTVGISLGGHLQVLFGVLGKRWRQQEWRDQYVTDAWIDMPERYHPPRVALMTDGGAYW